jgi:hypothetical protein
VVAGCVARGDGEVGHRYPSATDGSRAHP